MNGRVYPVDSMVAIHFAGDGVGSAMNLFRLSQGISRCSVVRKHSPLRSSTSPAAAMATNLKRI